jgi:arabinogalactan endo-1,4-beta-galactosidase
VTQITDATLIAIFRDIEHRLDVLEEVARQQHENVLICDRNLVSFRKDVDARDNEVTRAVTNMATIADAQLSDLRDTIRAVAEASNILFVYEKRKPKLRIVTKDDGGDDD